VGVPLQTHLELHRRYRQRCRHGLSISPAQSLSHIRAQPSEPSDALKCSGYLA
jgi:hypothetical protein